MRPENAMRPEKADAAQSPAGIDIGDALLYVDPDVDPRQRTDPA